MLHILVGAIGQDSAPNDPRYHLDQPWANGRFAGGFGLQHVYVIAGGRRDRFWFGTFFWSISPSDYNNVVGWLWVGDPIVILEDRNRGAGAWYIAFNRRVGTYAHVEYLGD